jgi:ABC-type nitrate/sulfonate/bicarbonate transport system substrate-binding protein
MSSNDRWPSWLITAHESLTSATGSSDSRLAEFLSGVTKGIEYFHSHIEEGIAYIAENLGYTAQDARDWLKTVEHVKDASRVDPSVIQNTVNILQKAGVVKGDPSVDSLVVKEAL